MAGSPEGMTTKPRLLLHIGTEKTGTTSIQHYLHDNKLKLLDQDIFYPRSLGKTNHRVTPFLAYNQDRLDDFCKVNRLFTMEERQAMGARAMKSLGRELELHADCRWIISSEHFAARLTTAEEIERLQALLDSLFELDAIIIYLRKPIEASISKWSTAIKAGIVRDTLPPPRSGVADTVCNHRQILELWMSVFGRERLKVRLFQRGDFIGGDLIRDFCAACAIDAEPLAEAAVPRNQTLSYQGMKLLSCMNEKIPPIIDNMPNIRRRGIDKYFMANFSAFPGYRPSRCESDLYESFYQSSSDWVRDNFFPDKSTLWLASKCRHDDDQQFTPGLTPLELAFVDSFVSMWNDLHP